MTELEQELYEEGLWVSGMIENFSIKEIDHPSPTKTALFNSLYQGPCWAQPFQNLSDLIGLQKIKKLIIYDDSWHLKTIKLSKKVKELIELNQSTK